VTIEVGSTVLYLRGAYVDATVAAVNMRGDVLVSCDLDVAIPARMVKGVEVPAHVLSVKGVRRDAAPLGMRRPFTWVEKEETP
jgi:predicted nucleotidyltransferase